jgi:2-polyprenyl-6-methoxyphenol hydroxylase-like FAD-dependent oxidoreductase
MMAALELAHHGVEVLLAEQNAGPTAHPKMEFTNPRTMEHHARLGLAADIRQAGVGPEYSFDVVWSTCLGASGWLFGTSRRLRSSGARSGRATTAVNPASPTSASPRPISNPCCLRGVGAIL